MRGPKATPDLEIPSGVALLVHGCLAESRQAIALYDPDDILRWTNAAYEERFLRGRALPIPFADVIRHGFHSGFGVHIGSGDVERFLADVQQRRRSAPFRAFEVDTVDGDWFWMTETLVAGWLLSIGTDISALKNNERVLRQEREHAVRAAQVDPLTGIANRRHALDLGERFVVECRDDARPMSVAVLDIDHFKQINDRFGHHVGDDVLASFARFVLEHLRDHDVMGRIGGEEFLVLLPGASSANAAAVLQRLQDARMTLPPAGLPAFSFSAGIAELRSGEGLACAVKRADAALYQAKRNGRNRCEVAQESQATVTPSPPSPDPPARK